MLHVSDSSCHVALQAKFVENQQALLHGDLHTGSLMVTEDTTYVIDAEFAFYGPIAFDVSKMVANLLIAYFASFGLETADSPRIEQRRWLLQVGTAFWHDFKFVTSQIDGGPGFVIWRLSASCATMRWLQCTCHCAASVAFCKGRQDIPA